MAFRFDAEAATTLMLGVVGRSNKTQVAGIMAGVTQILSLGDEQATAEVANIMPKFMLEVHSFESHLSGLPKEKQEAAMTQVIRLVLLSYSVAAIACGASDNVNFQKVIKDLNTMAKDDFSPLKRVLNEVLERVAEQLCASEGCPDHATKPTTSKDKGLH